MAAAGFEVEVLELGDQDGRMESDFAEVDQVRRRLAPGRAVVALGSGKLCDVTKHACHLQEQRDRRHLGLVVLQTANSVIAFGSGMATITKDGVKRTWPSRLPDALVLDERTLREAPSAYTLGGIGDLAVIAVSFGDWYLAAEFGLSRYTPAAFEVLGDVREQLLSPERAAALGAGGLDGAELLGKLAVLGGFAMTLAGQSSPMSGYEHAVSHMLDMCARPSGRPVRSHGCQCGISTIVCAIAWQRLLQDLRPDKVDLDTLFPAPDAVEPRVRATFDALDPSGAMAEECWRSYRGKLVAWHGRPPPRRGLPPRLARAPGPPGPAGRPPPRSSSRAWPWPTIRSATRTSASPRHRPGGRSGTATSCAAGSARPTYSASWAGWTTTWSTRSSPTTGG